MLSVILVTYNSEKYLQECIGSLPLACGDTPFELIAVDNASSDGTLEWFRRNAPFVRTVANTANVGFSKAVNTGLPCAGGDTIVIANADTVFRPGSLEKLNEYLNQNRHVGIVGPQLLFPDGSWQRSGGRWPGVPRTVHEWLGLDILTKAVNRHRQRHGALRGSVDIGYVDGTAMAVRREVLSDIGMLDEGFFFYAEDVEYCRRAASAGWRVRLLREAHVVHIRGGSSTRLNLEKFVRLRTRSDLRFVELHRGRAYLALFILLEMGHTVTRRLAYLITRFLPSLSGRSQPGLVSTSAHLSELWAALKGAFARRPRAVRQAPRLPSVRVSQTLS